MRPHRSAVLVGLAALAAAACCAAGEGPWKRHVVDDSSRGADGVRLADVNGDGRPDIVTGWEQGGVTRLYVNPGPDKAAAKWPAVTVGRTPDVEDALLVDLDGDGQMDAVTCCEGGTRSMFVHWAPKDKARRLDATAWQTQAIPASQKAMMWMFAAPMQIDGRAGVDLVAAGKGGGAKVGWFEVPADPRDLTAWKWHPLIDAGWIMSVIPADMDGDGDEDVVVSDRKGGDTGCYWLENPGAAAGEQLTRPWARHWIGSRGRGTMFVRLADLDGDGLTDVLAGEKPRNIAFHRRLSKDGRQWETRAIAMPETAGTAKAVNVGDIDLDGRMDVVFTCEEAKAPLSGMMWLSAPKDAGDANWTPHDISGPEGVKYDLVELVDLDGDGDLDALTCEEATNLGVIWYENPARQPAARP